MDSTPTLSALDVITASLRVMLRGMFGGFGAWRQPPVWGAWVQNWLSAQFRRLDELLAQFRAGDLVALAAETPQPRPAPAMVARPLRPARRSRARAVAVVGGDGPDVCRDAAKAALPRSHVFGPNPGRAVLRHDAGAVIQPPIFAKRG